MTIEFDSTELTVFSLFYTGVCLPHIALTFKCENLFNFPETCYIKNNVLLETMWCVLLLRMRDLWDVHHCALWIHLCGSLAVLKWFAWLHKGTLTIIYSFWFLFGLIYAVMDDFIFYNVLNDPICTFLKAWWAFDITIKNLNIILLNRNITKNKKIQMNSKLDICLDADTQYIRINNISDKGYLEGLKQIKRGTLSKL